MDEFQVTMKARQFVRDAGIPSIPVDLELYAAKANATIKVKYDLSDDESGHTFPAKGRHIIVLNGNHREERQRFTALHEIAHVILGLPSQHGAPRLRSESLFSYRRRPLEEIACDTFAAECLLPYIFFKNDVENEEMEFNAIRNLATLYKASLPATGSRFASHATVPCAFALIEHRKVRYVSYSKHLRELSGWIKPGAEIPASSVARKAIAAGDGTQVYDEIPTDIWFENVKIPNKLICEEAIYLSEWDQCLSLIWVDHSLNSTQQRAGHYDDDDESLLHELDGNLPWPSKRRRR